MSNYEWPTTNNQASGPVEENPSTTPAELSEATQEPDIQRRARSAIIAICEEFEDPSQRVAEVIKKVTPFFHHLDKAILSNKTKLQIQTSLEACAEIQDKQQFIDEAIKALKPFFDIRELRAFEFEEAQAKIMNEVGGFTKINRLLLYDIYKTTLCLHVTPSTTVEHKLGLFRDDGMPKLAQIINNNPGIEEIVATSWIVAKNPKIFTNLGFTVIDLSAEDKSRHYAGEEREIKTAVISRENFLERFLKK